MQRKDTLLKTCPTCFATMVCAMLFWSPLALACEVSTSKDAPLREIVTCGDAVTLEREPTAQMQITERPNDAAPRVIDVQGGAILINVSPGHSPTEVRSPHAIATVRGTTYIVDAGAEQTSVFVLEGGVNVRRVNDEASVTLGPGEGTDVSLEAPLSVRTWGAARADALLARFGR